MCSYQKMMCLVLVILMLGMAGNALAADTVIVPTGADDAERIQAALDDLENGNTLTLNGDFVIAKTIYLPSNFTWILNGSLTLHQNVSLDQVGWVDGPIDARRPTAISEKFPGATNIDMSGGTYYGYDIHNGTSTIRFYERN